MSRGVRAMRSAWSHKTWNSSFNGVSAQ